MQDMKAMRTALYRHFDDEGTLLYVGISLSAINRLSQHKGNDAPWYGYIARVDIEWHQTREKAEAAERLAIQLEGPVFNTLHSVQATRQPRLLLAAARADQAEANLKALIQRGVGDRCCPRDSNGYVDPAWVVRQAFRDAWLTDGDQERLCV